jgi:hypothetical protein
MKTTLTLFISFCLILFGIIKYSDYSKRKSIENCQTTNDEKSLISCFEFSTITINEKMVIIKNHKDFKFFDSSKLIIYTNFLTSSFGECNATFSCKTEYKEILDSLPLYKEKLIEQCLMKKKIKCKDW